MHGLGCNPGPVANLRELVIQLTIKSNKLTFFRKKKCVIIFFRSLSDRLPSQMIIRLLVHSTERFLHPKTEGTKCPVGAVMRPVGCSKAPGWVLRMLI